MTNPLLELDGLPAFATIRPDHVTPAIESLLAQEIGRASCRERVCAIV